MKKLLGVAALLSAVVAVVAISANAIVASSVTLVAGNPTCPGGHAYTVKIDPPANGTFAFNGSSQTIQITNMNGTTFDWHITDPNAVEEAIVIVKGGPNALIYDYTGVSTDSDTGLHAPLNLNNGKYYGLSHIQFCFDPKV
jgi:hypothetical protein